MSVQYITARNILLGCELENNENIILDNTSLPFRTTDAAVSSHDVSMPKINISFSIIFFFDLSKS